MERSRGDSRNAYERDYDRILFSSAFRRLQNKTQIFPLPEHKLVHNRLTHSLEVVQVGRSLAHRVGEVLSTRIDYTREKEAHTFFERQLPSVIAAACLAHDLGNPAFGHAGEEALSQYFLQRQHEKSFRACFGQAEWADLIQFEGNANAFRILTHQYPYRPEGGFQPTFSTLAALIKYPCESLGRQKRAGKHRSKYGFFQSDRGAFEKLTEQLPFRADSQEPLAYFRHPFVYLTEAADDICYLITDYEDAHRLGLLSYPTIRADFLSLLDHLPEGRADEVQTKVQHYEPDHNEAVAYLRAKCISALVEACREVFLCHEQELLQGCFVGSLMDHLAEAKPALQHIQGRSKDHIYRQESVLKIELAGFKIMSGLVGAFTEAVLCVPEQRHREQEQLLSLIPAQFIPRPEYSDYEKVMLILDFTSGMTDNYALELYRNLSGISLPHL